MNTVKEQNQTPTKAELNPELDNLVGREYKEGFVTAVSYTHLTLPTTPYV